MTQETILKYGVKLIIIFLVIPIHEFAHAWSAVKLGDDTPKYQGRLTLNPLAHVDPIGAICIFFTGFGWGKPVQVNPNNFRKYRKGSALCSAAGPISNLIVATIGLILHKIVWAVYVSNNVMASYWIAYILYIFVYINIGLAIFNLIPIPPLDGSKILSYFTPPKYDKFVYENQMYISIIFLVLLLTGVLDGPIGFLQSKMYFLLDKLTFWVDLIIGVIVR